MIWTVWTDPTCVLTATIPHGNVDSTRSMGMIAVGRLMSWWSLEQVISFKSVTNSSRAWILLNISQFNFSHVLCICYRIIKYRNVLGRIWSIWPFIISIQIRLAANHQRLRRNLFSINYHRIILSVLSNEFRCLIDVISVLLDQVYMQPGLLRHSIRVFEQTWILFLYLGNSNPGSTEWLITCLNKRLINTKTLSSNSQVSKIINDIGSYLLCWHELNWVTWFSHLMEPSMGSLIGSANWNIIYACTTSDRFKAHSWRNIQISYYGVRCTSRETNCNKSNCLW